MRTHHVIGKAHHGATWAVCLCLALTGWATAPLGSAQDTLIVEEGWHGGFTEGWRNAVPGGMTDVYWSAFSPGGILGGRADGQLFPVPESGAFFADASASGGRFAGNYYADGYEPESFRFDFLAGETSPSYLWLNWAGQYGGTTRVFRTLWTNLLPRGVWQSITVPLAYGSGGWSGGSETEFTNALADVQWVEVRVTRNGPGEQSYYLDNFGVSLLVPGNTATNDTDGDGMPDYWEDRYFGGPTNGLAESDDDGDGFSNREEFIADTAPDQENSYFRIYGFSWSTNALSITFPSRPGRYYNVEAIDRPHADPQAIGPSDVAGDGQPRSILVTNAVWRTWYRLKVHKP
jgi:hypothetical protein